MRAPGRLNFPLPSPGAARAERFFSPSTPGTDRTELLGGNASGGELEPNEGDKDVFADSAEAREEPEDTCVAFVPVRVGGGVP